MAKNLTQGSPAKLIFFFALPLFIGNLFQQIYNMADTLIVGRTIGVTALAGVGSTGSLLFLVLGFVMGMTSGFSIVTAQFFGACNKVGVRRSFCAGILLSAVVAAVLTISGVLLSRTVLVLMLTPPEIMEDAHSYIIVISWGIGAAVLFVTHSMEYAALLAQRIVVMDHGRILMDGTPQQIFSRSEKLLRAGLDVPQVTRVFLELKKRGVPVDPAVYTVSQAAEALRRLKGGERPC